MACTHAQTHTCTHTNTHAHTPTTTRMHTHTLEHDQTPARTHPRWPSIPRMHTHIRLQMAPSPHRPTSLTVAAMEAPTHEAPSAAPLSPTRSSASCMRHAPPAAAATRMQPRSVHHAALRRTSPCLRLRVGQRGHADQSADAQGVQALSVEVRTGYSPGAQGVLTGYSMGARAGEGLRRNAAARISPTRLRAVA